MIQFYFLSVLLNILAGYALCVDSAPRHGKASEHLRDFLKDRSVRLVLGILAAVTGCLKLVTTIRGDIPVIGDFLPACAGIAVGLTLLLELDLDPAATEPRAEGEPSPRAAALRARLEAHLLANRNAIGLAGLVTGLVHFLFPAVLFL